MLRAVALSLVALSLMFAESRELDLASGSGWVDTGIDLQPGDTCPTTATGQMKYIDAKQNNGPEGLTRGWTDLIRTLPVNEAGRGAVVARIGTNAAARAFLVGAQKDGSAPIAGKLYVSINEPGGSSGTGRLHIKIEHTARPKTTKADGRM